jgi:osmotically-inducible protein OsmY
MKRMATAFMVTLSLATAANAKVWTFSDQQIDVTRAIDREQSTGNLTYEEAAKLKAQEDVILKKEKMFKEKHNGVLSLSEQKELKRDLNSLDRQVHKVVAIKPNNTGKNLGDDRADSPTAQAQSEKKDDITIVSGLRKQIVADKSLSLDAKNAKIVTVNGTVTLRGPVASNAEKEKLGSLAEHCVGSKNVCNELTVISNTK